MFRGLAAIIEAYLIYWALVYFIARRYFKFSREWAAPLASGISICGVSAAITTGAAIRARPVVPIMVSSLVVVFSYEPGWLLTTTTTVKVFIDVFIGVWALVLAAVWSYGIEKDRKERMPVDDILRRLPRFVLGYVASLGQCHVFPGGRDRDAPVVGRRRNSGTRRGSDL